MIFGYFYLSKESNFHENIKLFIDIYCVMMCSILEHLLFFQKGMLYNAQSNLTSGASTLKLYVVNQLTKNELSIWFDLLPLAAFSKSSFKMEETMVRIQVFSLK